MTNGTEETRRELGWGTLRDEHAYDALEVEGELPPWLTGTLLRSGVSMFEGDGWSMRHWFDGLAMLHAFTFAAGSVSYRNRILHSRAHHGVETTGRPTRSEFGTDPCRSLFQRVQAVFHPKITDNGAITVNRLGDEFVAMTETPMAVEFDPRTLETLDIRHRSLAPGTITTAHAHVDEQSGGMLNFALKVGREHSYRFYTVGATGGPQVIARTATRHPGYVHSFGATDEHVVLLVGPLVLNLRKLATAPLTKRSFIECYDWRPELGTTVIVVDRRTGAVVREFRTDPMFVFHHANCYREGDELVVDVTAYDDPGIIDALYLDRLRAGGPFPVAHLRRLRLDLTTGGVAQSRLSETPVELPRIDYGRRNGLPYRYVYGTTVTDDCPQWLSGLVKVDVSTGAATTWTEPGLFPSEPVFVPTPGGQAEDDGVLLSITLDAGRRGSELTVLDAATLKPVARARVPHPIPFGFHAYHYGDVTG